MNRRELFKGFVGGILSAILPSKELDGYWNADLWDCDEYLDPQPALDSVPTTVGAMAWNYNDSRWPNVSWAYYKDGEWYELSEWIDSFDCKPEFEIRYERRPGT